jgi:hypothetical protein
MKMKRLVGMGVMVMALVLSDAIEAADLTGAWKGLLSSADGSQAEVQIDFSPQGFPLYSYTNNKGLTRQVELSQVGQTVEYVPPGGGVQRMVVERVEKGQGDCRSGSSAPSSGRVRAIWISGRKRRCSNMPSSPAA